jgi:F-type H+-transporting ATPase subunit gamma
LKSPPSQTPNRIGRPETVAAVAEKAFLEGTYSRVFVLFTRFFSMLKQSPTVEQILPVPLLSNEFPWDPDSKTRHTTQACDLFEPEPQTIALRLLHEYFEQAVRRNFLNSFASENAARHSAMSRASDNAGDMLDNLMATYWRLRQESITTEITELARGSTA